MQMNQLNCQRLDIQPLGDSSETACLLHSSRNKVRTSAPQFGLTTCQSVRFSLILLFDQVQQKLKLATILGRENGTTADADWVAQKDKKGRAPD